MSLNTNAQMTLVDFAVIPAPQYPPATGETGVSVSMHFFCVNPGPNMPGDYYITLTSTDLTTINAAANKQQALQTTVVDHLQKQYRPTTQITAVLQGLVGQSVTV